MNRMKAPILAILLFFLFPVSTQADLVPPPYEEPTFENQQSSIIFDIRTVEGSFATSSVSAGVPLTLLYELSYPDGYFRDDTLTPEQQDELFQIILEDSFLYMEVWRGIPFTSEATFVESKSLPAERTGAVMFEAFEPGEHFLVLFKSGVRDFPTYCARYNVTAEECARLAEESVPVEQARQFFTTSIESDEWFGYQDWVYGYNGTRFTVVGDDRLASNVLFLPGIKGSRLYDGDGNKLWEPFGDHDVEALYLDTSGKSVRSDVHTKPGDIVDSVALLLDIYGSFAEFMDGLVEDGTIAEWRAVPYDWRLSLPDIVEGGTETDGRISYIGASEVPYIRKELEALAETSRSGKVTIVAHSNGGLVAKELMRQLGEEEAARLIDDVILVGVPQSGAPQALGALLYGYKEGLPWWFPGIVSTATARQFAENSPMGYHLLPSDAYFRDVDDETHAVVRFENGKTYEEERAAYGSLVDSFTELAAFARADEGGREKPLALNVSEANVLNATLLAYAEDVHEALDLWNPPEGISVHQIAGWGEETVSGIEYYERCVLSLCYPKYRPTFVEDGDGVVPVPSALMMSEAENVERYWIDLQAHGFSLLGKKDHGNLLSIDDIQNLIKGILLKDFSELPASVFAEEITGTDPEKQLHFFLHSPLSLELYDRHGNRVGPNEDGGEDEEIPGASYGQFGEVQYLIAPAGNEYRLELHGYEAGTFTLEIEEVKDTEITAAVAFTEIPTTESTVAHLEISENFTASEKLHIDREGDGEFESVLAATGNESDDHKPESRSKARKFRDGDRDAREAREQQILQLRILLLKLLLEYLQTRYSYITH